MKIKVTNMEYDKVLALKREKHKPPIRQGKALRTLLKTLSQAELKSVDFSCSKEGMDRLKDDEPCMFIMNHSSFIDLKIASVVLYPRQFHIICTNDGFVGKNALLRAIGCIPTKKFINDATLIKDINYAVKKLNSSILMYPEASYSFDGTATPLPKSMGKFLKMLGIPVVMIRTYGAFSRDPLYNGLRVRDVKVTADMKYLLSPQQLTELNYNEINEILKKEFTFDHFRWQHDNGIRIDEDFRAEGLERVLYKCPACGREGHLHGHGTKLTCGNCGKEYELNEYGMLTSDAGEAEYEYVSDWYEWERSCVRDELNNFAYKLDIPVNIGMLIDTKSIYMIGRGRLVHTDNGFILDGCDGKLHYEQSPEKSYSLYSDYYWYEIGDVICIGDNKTQYYCFPVNEEDNDEAVIVAKARLATEEIFKKQDKRRNRADTLEENSK